MILTATLNPSVDRTLFVDGLNQFGSNRVVRTEMDAGGKGLNVSRIVAECGAATRALTFLGGDTSALIRDVLCRERVPIDEIPVAGETRMNVSVEDGSGQPPTTFNERGPTISGAEREAFWASLKTLAAEADWVALGGSLPPGIEQSAYAELVQIVQRIGANVAVDADGEALRLALESKPHLVKPNQEEVSRLLGRSVVDLDGALEAARDIHRQGVRHAFVSMGAKGAVYCGAEACLVAMPPKIEPCSTIGSGDSLIGGFLAGLQKGLSVVESIRLGTACGAATATTSGAEIGRWHTIEKLLPEVSIELR